MQPGCPGTVETKPADENDPGDGVTSLGQAGAGEIVVDKALRGEAAEEPLNDPVLQVEVNHVLVHGASVVEDDRTNGRFSAPFPGLLIAFPGRRSVSMVSAQVGSAPCRWSTAGNWNRSIGVSQSSPWDRLQGIGVHHLEGARDGGTEMVLAESDDFFRPFFEGTKPVDLCFEAPPDAGEFPRAFFHDALTAASGSVPSSSFSSAAMSR